jgi:hypothetical protein
MSILEKFNDKEISALNRATAKLRLKQPVKQPVKKTSGVAGIYLNPKSRNWTVYSRTNGVKSYVGFTTTLEGAKKLQADYNAEQAKAAAKTNKTTPSWTA